MQTASDAFADLDTESSTKRHPDARRGVYNGQSKSFFESQCYFNTLGNRSTNYSKPSSYDSMQTIGMKFLPMALVLLLATHAFLATAHDLPSQGAHKTLCVHMWICSCTVSSPVQTVTVWIHSAEVYAGHARSLKQENLSDCDGYPATNQCPSGSFWLCSSGSAVGGCRSAQQGEFPGSDCQAQCLVNN